MCLPSLSCGVLTAQSSIYICFGWICWCDASKMFQLIIGRNVLRHRSGLLLLNWLQQQQLRYLSRCSTFMRKNVKSERSTGSEVQEVAAGGTGRTDVSTDVRPLGEKIKENTKTATYTAIILVGMGVTGIMFWAIFRELFSSSSPNNIYSEALKRVKEDPRVQDVIGTPIKGYGEESRRGRRQHVAHASYDRNGVPHMRMQFYVRGLRNKATVHLEVRKNTSGKMEYRYLFVQLDYYPHTTIVLEDNRALDPLPSGSPQQPLSSSGLEFASFGEKK